MFRKWREAREEEGFTLIELLVVVIIIGILAAIAIPAFLNQRERAWQSELTSAVRNASLDIEAEATAIGGTYPATGDATTAGTGQFIATNWVNNNVNPDATPLGTPGVPIVTVVYTGVPDATSGVVTGFTLCMEHALIDETHSVTYEGGAVGNGITGFVRGTGC